MTNRWVLALALTTAAYLSVACTIVGKKDDDASDDGPSADAVNLEDVDPLFAFSVISFGPVQLHSSTAQGRVAASGNAQLSSYSIGTVLAKKRDRCDLAVGGDLTFSQGSVFQGRICVAGKISTVRVGTSFPGSSELDVDFGELAFRAAKLSKDLAGLKPIATIDEVYMNGGRAAVRLEGSKPGLNVFELTPGALGLATGIHIQVPKGASAVINVPGETARFDNQKISMTGASASTILFNLPTAKSLTLSQSAVQGSILAPKALMTFTEGQLLGTAVVAGASGDGRFDYKPYAGLTKQRAKP